MRQVEKSNPRKDPLFNLETDVREPESAGENLPPLVNTTIQNSNMDNANNKPNSAFDFIVKAVLFIAPIVGITIENPEHFTTAGIWGGVALALYLGYKIVRKYVLKL